jgi:spermidine/putrescine transport system ATP-binding protein
LGALDLKLRKGLQVQLKQIQREVGITFVYVTHDQEEALTMSDRIAVMNRGVIEQVQAPEDVYERPRTTFVAGFIGVSNLMPGEVVEASEAGAVLRLDSGIAVRARDAQGLRPGDRCHAVVRPEKLDLLPAEEALGDGRLGLEGTLESSLYLGTSTQVVVRLEGDLRMTVLVPNHDDAARRRLPSAGDPVRLVWAEEHMHLVREPEAEHPSAEAPEPNTTIPIGANQEAVR